MYQETGLLRRVRRCITHEYPTYFYFPTSQPVFTWLVLFPCEFKISLAVRQKQTLLTSTCDGSAVAQHGVFSQPLFTFIVLWLRQEPVAHNRRGGSARLRKYSGQKRGRLCGCLRGGQKAWKQACVLRAKWSLESFRSFYPGMGKQWSPGVLCVKASAPPRCVTGCLNGLILSAHLI